MILKYGVINHDALCNFLPQYTCFARKKQHDFSLMIS